MKAFYNVTQILSDYLKASLSINSVKIGALSEIDLKKNRVYPLANIMVDRVSYGPATQIFDVRILFVDTVYEPQNDLEAETIPQIGNDNSHDVLNTMLSVANQLQTTMRLGDLARNNFRLATEPTVEPFQDRFEDLVAGWVLNLSIEVPNVDISSCDYVADIYLPPSLSDTYMKISTYDTNNDGRVDQLEETDPIFSASPASTITEEDINTWNSSSSAPGASGYSGKSGYSGATGNNGETGLAGASGYSGTAGSAGASGYSGTSGASGTTFLFTRIINSDATTTSASLVNVTGLLLECEAYGIYEIEAQLITNSSTINGCKYGIGCTETSEASIACGLYGYYSTAAARAYPIRAFNTALAVAFNTAQVDGTILIKGIIITGPNAPVISIMHQKESSGTSKVYINSYLKMRKIN